MLPFVETVAVNARLRDACFSVRNKYVQIWAKAEGEYDPNIKALSTLIESTARIKVALKAAAALKRDNDRQEKDAALADAAEINAVEKGKGKATKVRFYIFLAMHGLKSSFLI